MQLSWVVDEESRERRHLLLTLGNDGKVIVWAWEGSRDMKIVRACRLVEVKGCL